MLLAKPEGNRLENPGQNISTVLKWNLKKCDGKVCGLDLSGSGYRPVVNVHEHGKELLLLYHALWNLYVVHLPTFALFIKLGDV